MSRDEILNMPAGTKMNQFIWWKIFDMTPEPKGNDMLLLPPWSTDMGWAWQLLERLSEKYECATAVGREYPYKRLIYTAYMVGGLFIYDNPNLKLYALAPTAPLAVARLSLLTVGEW